MNEKLDPEAKVRIAESIQRSGDKNRQTTKEAKEEVRGGKEKKN